MSKKEKKKKSKGLSAASSARSRAEKAQKGDFQNTKLELPDNTEMFTLSDGKPKKIDVLIYLTGSGNPYADKGVPHYERTFWVHRGIGAASKAYVCPQMESGGSWVYPGFATGGEKKCPICEAIMRMNKDPEADEDQVKALKLSQRQLFNVIDLKNKDKGVQIWDMSYWWFGKLLDARIKDEEEGDDYSKFADYTDGKTLRLTLEEHKYKKGEPSYEVTAIDFKDREDYDEDKTLKKVVCLDDLIKVVDYDELKEIFLQTADATDDEDEKPKAKKATKKSKKKVEEDDDDDDNEKEEPKSKKTSKKTTKKKVEDDDDDDDEDDDDEDDD